MTKRNTDKTLGYSQDELKVLETIIKNDGWSNILNNVKAKQDKSESFNYHPNNRLTFQEQDSIYDGDSIAANICDMPAKDMTREGITINHDKAKDFEKEYQKLNFWSEFKKALSYESAYCGSAVIMDIDDGVDDWSIPVNFQKIKGITDIFAIDRYFLTPVNNDALRVSQLFNINSNGITDRPQIHISRMLLFTGIDTGIRNRQKNQGFGQSRIDRIIQELRNYGIAHNVIPNILIEFVTGIFKLQDLNKQIAGKEDSKVAKKMQYISGLMGFMNKVVLDAGDSFENKSLNVSGIDKLIYMVERRLCAVAGIPHTKLLQESPGGGLTNNGGNSEQSQQWYDWIKAEQKEKLSPQINKFNKIVGSYLKVVDPDDIPFIFNPLHQKKESEIVANRKIVAETDQLYINMGIPAETIIDSRYGQGEYSFETTITPKDITAIKNKQKQLNNTINNKGLEVKEIVDKKPEVIKENDVESIPEDDILSNEFNKKAKVTKRKEKSNE